MSQPKILKYGGYENSDNPDSVRINDEPIINWNIESGMDYVTTFSQLKKEGYAFIYNTLTRQKPDTKTEKGYKPLTFYNLWNFDCIVSWGDNDANQQLAKNWFYSIMDQEKQKEILHKSMESGQILKDELHSVELKLKCVEGERDEYRYQLKKAEKEIKRLQILLEDAERNCFSDSD